MNMLRLPSEVQFVAKGLGGNNRGVRGRRFRQNFRVHVKEEGTALARRTTGGERRVRWIANHHKQTVTNKMNKSV